MAAGVFYDRSPLTVELAATLEPEQELFASSVASGLSYREAAKAAGFSEDYSWRIMQIPRVRARVEELLREPETRIKAGIRAELLSLRRRLANETLDSEGRANIKLRLDLIMSHAKLEGMIVERRQIAQSTTTVALDKLSPGEARAYLDQLLGKLEPGSQAKMQKLLDGPEDITDAECIDVEPVPAAKPAKPRKPKKAK